MPSPKQEYVYVGAIALRYLIAHAVSLSYSKCARSLAANFRFTSPQPNLTRIRAGCRSGYKAYKISQLQIPGLESFHMLFTSGYLLWGGTAWSGEFTGQDRCKKIRTLHWSRLTKVIKGKRRFGQDYVKLKDTSVLQHASS